MCSFSTEELEVIKNKFSSICTVIDDKLKIQQKNTQQLQKQIAQDIELIKAHIKEGLTSKAIRLLQSSIKQIDSSHYLSNSEKNALHKELKQFQLELGELSSWKSWAHDNERENLLKKAEDLFSTSRINENLVIEYREVTAQIKELRHQWK